MHNTAIDNSVFLESESENNQYESLISSAKIMLVDDEPINTDVLQTYLTGEGYSNFVTTSDSAKAISIMRAEKPDVVLLDLMMPEVSGFDVLQAMRGSKALQHIPVVILTSSDDAETKLRALQLGAMDFLAKPVDASELALRLRNTLAAKAYQHQMVNYDQLTGLAKLDVFVDNTQAALELLKAEQALGAAIHIHLENLKTVNNSMGRDTGNRFIQLYSRKLENCVRSTNVIRDTFGTDITTTLARTSGDKFSIFLGHIDNPQQAAVLARRIIIETSDPLNLEGQLIFPSTKIGISIFPDDAVEPQQLISNAETAMAYAKDQGGRESYAFYSGSMNEESTRILAIENGLHKAIENDELKVTYQPKVDLITGDIIGAEALIRWISPDIGFVSPDEFIPITERTGQIVPIGAWILERACSQAAEWQRQFAMDFKLAVNVSIRQIHDSRMDLTVSKIVEKTGFPASSLTLELTENMVMENAESNIELLHNLKDLGVRLSIDDFGTGYSSLSYLQRLPLDELKIDRSFIEEVQSEESRSPIVRAMVSMAHDLGMTVVAEGIETDVQLNHMKLLQCELYQGYLCSKPVVAKAFTELLKKTYSDSQ
jgi:diguanylate cyclase (GGDEF)-like protein